MGYKRIKDPIYGYISIESDFMGEIVDTAEFQRLRNIIQTSYSPLYSSAVHNRFVHSLGVYYLGTLVSKNINENFDKNEDITSSSLVRYLELFRMACLLHDLGHAPFSHTGEDFYLDNGERNNLHKDIVELIGDENLEKEISGRSYKANPHELMSVIVSLRIYSTLFTSSDEKSFFARCILGYPYFLDLDKKKSFLNCMISLLNSSVIDVDKLDYLIRDAYITGFDTVAIDYKRLLSSIRIITTERSTYKLVYKKGAISVIENVVYAHDSERKWIQTHPVVQYESYLLQTIMQKLKDKYNSVDLYSYKALSREGVALSKEYRISLLSDADILFLLKNEQDDVVDEYLCRKNRRHPLWKSESEYKAIFGRGYETKEFEVIENTLAKICAICNSKVLSNATKEQLKQDISKTERLKTEKPTASEELDKLVKTKKKYLEWLSVLEQFANELSVDFDFVIISTKQFNSGFAKEEFSKIEIDFDNLSKPCIFKDVTNVLNASHSDRDTFFYIFCKDNSKMTKDSDKYKTALNNLAIGFGKLALEESKDERIEEFETKFA